MSESCVTYEWVMARMNESCHIWMSHGTYEWVMARMNESWHVWMSHGTYEWVMAHVNESCHARINKSCHAYHRHKHVWIKLQVSFAKEPYKRDNILQKRPTIEYSTWVKRIGCYGVATVSSIDQITGLFCRILSLL